MRDTMHKLTAYAKAVNKTHKGLGNLVSFCLLTLKARKFVLIVSVAGTGKSTAMKAAVKANVDGSMMVQEFTRSGLGLREKELTGFKGVLMVEDLGNVDTSYSLKESIKAGIMLCYEHQLSKLNASTNLNIVDYNGSVITSVQPAKMYPIVAGSDWEAVMRDKMFRYYHLVRPLKPNRKPIEVKMSWGKPLESVKMKLKEGKLYSELEIMALNQWGKSRVNEHLEDMLKAAAALDNRTVVNQSDYKVVKELMLPMMLENYVLEKEGFESDKHFLHDEVCLLTEFATYGNPLKKSQIMTDFGISKRTLDRLLQKVRVLYTPDPARSDIIYASQETKTILEDCGY